MDEIAAQAGFSKPIIYRALGDKKAIAWAVADHLVAEVDRRSAEAARSGSADFRAGVRSYFELIERDRDILMFSEAAWGDGDGTHLNQLIERSARRFFDRFVDSAATADQPEWRRRTWSLATVGIIRVTARIWASDPYCTLDEVVDDVVTIVNNAHRHPTPS